MPVELKKSIQTELVWVVFQRRVSRLSSLQRFYCAPEFAHCWCYWPTYFPRRGLLCSKFTTTLEHTRYGMNVDVDFRDPEQLTQMALETDFITDVVAYKPRRHPHPTRLQTLNCVSVVKARLGVDAWWVWTPEQLWRYLRAHNGQSLKILE